MFIHFTQNWLALTVLSGARSPEESVWAREVGLPMIQPLGRAAKVPALVSVLRKDAQKTVNDGSY